MGKLMFAALIALVLSPTLGGLFARVVIVLPYAWATGAEGAQVLALADIWQGFRIDR